MKPYIGMILVNPMGTKVPYQVLAIEGDAIKFRYLDSPNILDEKLDFLTYNLNNGYAEEYSSYMEKITLAALFDLDS
jgi:hypothetical protein